MRDPLSKQADVIKNDTKPTRARLLLTEQLK